MPIVLLDQDAYRVAGPNHYWNSVHHARRGNLNKSASDLHARNDQHSLIPFTPSRTSRFRELARLWAEKYGLAFQRYRGSKERSEGFESHPLVMKRRITPVSSNPRLTHAHSVTEPDIFGDRMWFSELLHPWPLRPTPLAHHIVGTSSFLRWSECTHREHRCLAPRSGQRAQTSQWSSSGAASYWTWGSWTPQDLYMKPDLAGAAAWCWFRRPKQRPCHSKVWYGMSRVCRDLSKAIGLNSCLQWKDFVARRRETIRRSGWIVDCEEDVHDLGGRIVAMMRKPTRRYWQVRVLYYRFLAWQTASMIWICRVVVWPPYWPICRHVEMPHDRPHTAAIGFWWQCIGYTVMLLSIRRDPHKLQCRQVEDCDRLWAEEHRYGCAILQASQGMKPSSGILTVANFHWAKLYWYASWANEAQDLEEDIFCKRRFLMYAVITTVISNGLISDKSLVMCTLRTWYSRLWYCQFSSFQADCKRSPKLSRCESGTTCEDKTRSLNWGRKR